MSYSTMALALAVASVPICMLASKNPAPTLPLASPAQSPALGDCKSEIRPQLLAVQPVTESTTMVSATVMVTNLKDPTKQVVVKGSGSDDEEVLDPYRLYTLTVNYSGATPVASLSDDTGATVVTAFESIASHVTSAFWLTLVGSAEYDNAVLLQVNRNGFMTTVYLILEAI